MYTVMIVEDEVFVSAGLKNMIRWSDMDMTVIGEARNGKEGLEMYYQKKPDLILTDVKMPVMNGIDMITRIREHDTTTKIVVLSCHEDYDLVRQGFKLGITDYILKVKMMPEDIESVIYKVYDELQNEPAKREKAADGEEQLQAEGDSSEKWKDYIFQQSISDEEFRTMAAAAGIEEKGLSIGIMKLLSNEDPQVKEMILELIQNLLTEERLGLVFWEKENRYLYVLHIPDTDGAEERESFMDELFCRIRAMILTYLNRDVALGISSSSDSYRALPRLYEEAAEAVQKAVYLGEGIIKYGNGSDAQRYEEILNGFENRIANTDWLTNVCKRKILKEISFQKNKKKTPDVDTMKEIFGRWIHRTSFDNTVQRDEVLKIAVEAAKQIRTAASLPDMVAVFEMYLETMAQVEKSELVSQEVAQAVGLIRQHYCEEDISLSDVAHQVGMNKQYFSSLFKKETGQGFSDYVNRMRISKACELLENTSMKSYEVSIKVGFQDESYFSRVFKKMKGISPNEYRRCKIPPEITAYEGWKHEADLE